MTGKISEDPPATTISGASFAAVQGGVNVQVPAAVFDARYQGGGGSDAESFGFVSGTTLGTEAATNKAAWNALLATGGIVNFGPGDWNMGFNAQPSGVLANVVITGAGGKTTRFLGVTSWTYADIVSGCFEIQDVYWDFGATALTTPQLLGFDNKTADVDLVRVDRCWFRNIGSVVKSSSAGTNQFTVDRLLVRGNTVRNRNGLGRIHRAKFNLARYEDNDIDCANGVSLGGPQPAYGGIVHGYAQDGSPAGSVMPEDTGQIEILHNRVRNIKPGSDPGSPGCYGIQTQSYNSLIEGNIVEKVYPFYGTNYTGEALFTGNGSSQTFTGTLAHFPTPDSLKVITSGSTIATDNDFGWSKSDGTVGSALLWVGRQIISGTGVVGWVDYNTKQWSLTFTSAPANAAAYTATYFEGAGAIDNIEPVYAKAGLDKVINNSVLTCSGRQGQICIKGGGADGYNSFTALSYQGGGGSQYGAIVTGNVIRQRVRTGCFSTACAFWVQQDFATITNNLLEGTTDRIIRTNVSGNIGRNLIFANNVIKDHYGSSIVFLGNATDWTNCIIADNVIDGWWGTNASTTLQILRITSGGTHKYKNILISNNMISERCEVANSIVCAAIDITTGGGEVDIVIDGMKSLIAYYGFEKTGTGTAGRTRMQNYCTENLTAVTNLVSGSAITNSTDDGGYA